MMAERKHPRAFAVKAVALLLCCMVLTGCTTRAEDIAEAQRRLTAEIPEDATPADVLRYLDSHKVQHSGYEHGSQGNSIHAIIQERIGWHLIKRNYTAEYRFNQRDGLVEMIVAVKYSVL
jgi:hypothetical protein